ncbi:MAG: hypothetical protein QGI08_01735 [Paracoccaceae bacterium]|jgi:hypothetical protein|nr:hypothetical protein [Paracoccaceae bacterium]MDP7184425.1 hypothetical protein [Paracoccaceae bacterium]
MSVTDDLADALARDTIEAMDKIGDDNLINEVAKQLAATSTTSEEAYMTSIRVRLAERRARNYLQKRIADFAAGNSRDK